MGGVAAMESQYGHPGLYIEQVGLIADPSLTQMPPPPNVILSQQTQQHPIHQIHLQNQTQQVAVAAAQTAVLRQGQTTGTNNMHIWMHDECPCMKTCFSD
jgi:hypothetical protein